MANPIVKNDNRIYTGFGDFKDIQVNLLDIIKRGLEFEGYAGPISGFQDINPEQISITDVPAIFAWTDGLDNSSESVGGTLGRSLSEKSEIFCTVQLVHCGLDETAKQDEVLRLASLIEDIVKNNLNLNDIANGGGDIIQVDLGPSLLKVNNRLRSMRGFKIHITYTRTSRSRRATR